MNAKISFPHLKQLDGIRAIAVTLVFIAHVGFDRLVPGGFGVTIFFFLSGYLITSLLVAERDQTGKTALGAFYLRRTLRIWPPLWITMAFCALAIRVGWLTFDVDGWGVVAQLAFLINYAYLWGHPDGLPYLALWSLAVEEHFYLVFPLLFSLILSRMRAPRAALTCLVLCAVVLVVRVATVVALDDFSQIYFWSHTRIDSILFGCLLALWRNPVLSPDPWRPRMVHLLAAFALLLVCFAIRSEIFRQTLRYTLQGVALYVVFAWVLLDRGICARVLSSRPMQLLGLYSYTIYLVHYIFIGIIFTSVPSLPLALRIVLAAIMSLGYAKLMHDWVERPSARLRKILHGSGRRATGVSAP